DRVRFGLKVNQQHLGWPDLLTRVRYGEDQGFDGAWLFDHLKPPDGDPAGPCMEGWALLAALAASTQRIRLGVMVTGITYRHPSRPGRPMSGTPSTRSRRSPGRSASWRSTRRGQGGTRPPSPGRPTCRSRSRGTGWPNGRRLFAISGSPTS